MLVFNIDLSEDIVPLKELIYFAETQGKTDDIFKEYIVTLLIEDENALSHICGIGKMVGQCLKDAAIKDLKQLFTVFGRNPINGYIPTEKHVAHFKEYGESLMSVAASNTPDDMLDKLILHYQTFGGGKNAKYIAFKWKDGLQGIVYPDSITLNNLYCLDQQKRELISNTELFIKGKPYQNAILYGDRGSGKSSMVKAILNNYYNTGLRMAEISKERLKELPMMIDAIKNSCFKYIVFLDDLSFEQNDHDYKHLKVVLDGQIERQPKNIMFYATSNRRHLVNETWAERTGDDVHINDTMNEKLSLSERFGINMYFPSPTQKEYLDIVKGILTENGLSFTEDIKADAIRWSVGRSGRTGRIASQFCKTVLSSYTADIAPGSITRI